jgi:hypothetical protein
VIVPQSSTLFLALLALPLIGVVAPEVGVGACSTVGPTAQSGWHGVSPALILALAELRG